MSDVIYFVLGTPLKINAYVTGSGGNLIVKQLTVCVHLHLRSCLRVKIFECNMPTTRTQNNSRIRNKSKVGSPTKKQKESHEELVENRLARKESVYSSASDSEDDFDEVQRRKYEELRLKNIQDNAAFFSKLGIDQLKQELSKPKDKPKPSSRGLKEVRRQSSPPRRRSSLRLRKINPDGVPLPPEPITTSSVEEHPRVPSGPLRMSESVWSDTDAIGEEKFMRRLRQNFNRNATTELLEGGEDRMADYMDATAGEESLKKCKLEFSKMRLTEEHVAKVVPTRIFSITIHPTEDMLLVAAGGKWGRIGFWDVRKSGSVDGDGVIAYTTHSSPVNCIQFHNEFHDQMYSCSYDGTLRCVNFTTGIADEIYCAPYKEDTMLRNFDFLSPHTLIVSQSDGCVAVLDTRTDGTEAEHIYSVHAKALRSVSVHPKERQYFASACTDGNVCVWDLRKMKTKSNHSLQTLPHGRSVNSAYFSPVTGKQLLTTSLDDRICLYDTVSPSVDVKLKRSIVHDNHAGRWLTQFRATWHPTREDLWVSGSMKRPRQIELFNGEGNMIAVLQDEYLASVCSLNSFHPTQNILAGGNSSGRVHVFM
ncbi:hypothetical protein ScPMuIL_016379 [Solemya velum]